MPARNLRVDPGFDAWTDAQGLPKDMPNETPPSILDARANTDAAVGLVFSRLEVSDRIKETKHIIQSFDGYELAVHQFDVAEATDPDTPIRPAILYTHGGGNSAGSLASIGGRGMAWFADLFNVPTFVVDYRLAPENPFPTPVEDSYAALKWLSANASQFNIDPHRIGVYGESAGGNQAAALALMARDRGLSPPLAKQMLVYPMLDDCGPSKYFNEDSEWCTSRRGWTDTIKLCWDAYLGEDKAGIADADVSPYAAPAREKDLRGLPSAYIDIGSLDYFRDETLDYASRLAIADVDVEMHLYSGVPHMYEFVAPKIPLVLNALDNRRRAIHNM